MIKILDDLPENVLGVSVSGEVTKDDYDKIVLPGLNKLAKKQGEINYLVVLKADVDAFTAGVWWDDFKLGLDQFDKWNKIAIVSDEGSIKKITNLFSFAFPGESRGFKSDEYSQALKWVTA